MFLHLLLVMPAAAGVRMPRRLFRASGSAGMSAGRLSSNRATRRTADMRSWRFWLGNEFHRSDSLKHLRKGSRWT